MYLRLKPLWFRLHLIPSRHSDSFRVIHCFSFLCSISSTFSSLLCFDSSLAFLLLLFLLTKAFGWLWGFFSRHTTTPIIILKKYSIAYINIENIHGSGISLLDIFAFNQAIPSSLVSNGALFPPNKAGPVTTKKPGLASHQRRKLDFAQKNAIISY